MLFLVNSEFRTILSFVLDYTLEATKAFRAFISTENWCSSRVLIYKQHRPRCSWYTFERKSVCGVQRRHGVSGIPDKFKESLQSPRGQVCVCVYTRYIFISSYCAASNIFHFEATLKFHVQSLFFVYSCSKVTEPNVRALRSSLLFPHSRNDFLRRKKEFHVISFVLEIFADFCPFSNEYIALIPKFKSMETKF